MDRCADIAIVSQRVPPAFSGAGKRAIRQARELAGRGFCPTIFNASNVHETREDLELAGPRLPSWYFEIAAADRFFIPKFFHTFYQSFRRGDFELVHSISPGAWFNLSALAAARLQDIPVLIEPTMLGGDDIVTISQTRLGNVKRWLLEQANGIINISPGIMDRSADTNFDASDLFLVPNPVDCERFHPPDDDERSRLKRTLGLDDFSNILLSVGRISPRKGSRAIFEVFGEIARDHPETALALVGPMGSEHFVETLRTRIRDSGLEKRVFLPGRSDRVDDWMKAADIYLFASEKEGLPNVLLEAMASGMAIVSRRLEGITDFVLEHGETGMIISDRADMTRTLYRLLEDSNLRDVLGQRAREEAASQFAQERIAQQYSRVFEQYL